MPTYVEKECPHCSKMFMVQLAQKHQACCSRLCSDALKKARCRTNSNCPTCGVEFEYLKSWPRIHCSHICSGKVNAKNVNPHVGSRYTAICEHCGISYETTPSGNRGRFCSLKCFGKWKSINQVGDTHPTKGKKLGRPKNLPPPIYKTCIQCGTNFLTKKSHFDNRKCCSRKCSGDYASKTGIHSGANSGLWRGGYEPYYGPSWRKAQRAVRQRDKVCQNCGVEPKSRALDIHHIIPFRKFGADRHEEANTLSNLIALCSKCHKKLEPRTP